MNPSVKSQNDDYGKGYWILDYRKAACIVTLMLIGHGVPTIYLIRHYVFDLEPLQTWIVTSPLDSLQTQSSMNGIIEFRAGVSSPIVIVQADSVR